jgi:hypothetical protein
MGAYRVLRRSEWEDWATEEYAEDGQSREWEGASQAARVAKPRVGVRAAREGREKRPPQLAMVGRSVARVECCRRRSVGRLPNDSSFVRPLPA